MAAGLHTEYYEYDAVNRLTTHWSIDDIGNPALPSLGSPRNWTLQQHLRYDVSGNILCKSDVYAIGGDCTGQAHYIYDGSNNAGPHAVAKITQSDDDRKFHYDDNGNLIYDVVDGRADRELVYTAFNKLKQVRRAQATSDFHYGPDRSRYLHRKLDGDTILERIHYVGGVEFVYEGNDLPGTGQNTQFTSARRSIAGVALETLRRHSIDELRYQHVDHLGSIVAFSDAFGDVTERMSFDGLGCQA